MSRRWLAATALASLVALAGCSHGLQSSSGSLDGAVAKAPAATAAPGIVGSAKSSTCATVPTSSGPLAGSVRVTVSAPATAPAGSTLRARVTVQVVASGPTFPSGLSGLTVLRRGSVVAESAVAAIGINRALSIGSSKENTTVVLRECSQSPTGTPLAPGEYQVVASLGYHAGADSGYWVSAPITVTVR